MPWTATQIRDALAGIKPDRDPGVQERNWRTLKNVLENALAPALVPAGAAGRVSLFDSGGAPSSSAELTFDATAKQLVIGTDAKLSRPAANTLRVTIGSTVVFETVVTGVTLAEGMNLAFGTTTGTKLGTAATQKTALFGATPVVQPANIADPAGGAVIDAECRAVVNLILDLILSIGLMAAP